MLVTSDVSFKKNEGKIAKKYFMVFTVYCQYSCECMIEQKHPFFLEDFFVYFFDLVTKCRERWGGGSNGARKRGSDIPLLVISEN